MCCHHWFTFVYINLNRAFVIIVLVAAHLRSFFEKVGSLPRIFIVYICAHIFPGKRYDCAHCISLAAKLSVLGQATDSRSLYFIGSQAISFRPSDGFIGRCVSYVMKNYVIYRIVHSVIY